VISTSSPSATHRRLYQLFPLLILVVSNNAIKHRGTDNQIEMGI
jgi:hypothetical protein